MIKDYKKHIFDLLRNIQLFSSLTDEELHQIRGKMAVKRFKKNEVILYEENTNEVMYVILYGKVKVIQTTEEGKEIILAIHQSGDFFGEMSLIDNKTIPAVVAAMEDSVVAIISRKEFYSLLYTQGKVLDILLRILCARLRESWDRIQLLSFNNASQRIKTLLIMLSHEYGKETDEGTLLDIKLTHQDIADMAGVARETVTRMIDKLHRDGEIKVLKNKFILLGRDFLQKALKL
jgi:CRP/FNR family cyclic AMP-dependent transcriptional regulator